MKICKIIYKIIIMALIIMMTTSCICYADVSEESGGGETGAVIGDKALGLPTLSSGYKPVVEQGKVVEVTNTLLGVIIVVGIICIVVFIALTGFGTLLGSSAEGKAIAGEKYMGYLIAAILLTSGATIAKIVISVAEKFG